MVGIVSDSSMLVTKQSRDFALRHYFSVFVLIGAISWVLKAWVTDDAYITFRVVRNFVEGYGLTWNVDERVQVFTNPLWLLIHIPFFWLTRNIYLSTICISLALSLAAVWLIGAEVKKKESDGAAMLFLLACFLSDSISDYSTSGLENPLLLFLFALTVRAKTVQSTFPWWLFIVSLSLTTRFDSGLLYAPLVTFWFINRFRRVFQCSSYLALSPFLAWCIFAFVYYGFVFPNTYFAKLITGVDKVAYLHQGFRYLGDFVVNDSVAFFGVLIAVVSVVFGSKHDSLKKMRTLIFLGAMLQFSYIAWIGGDFMSGRLFSLPAFALLWVGCSGGILQKMNDRKLIYCILIIITLAISSYRHLPFFGQVGDHRSWAWRNDHAPSDEPVGNNYALVNLQLLKIRTDLSNHFYLREHERIMERIGASGNAVIRRGAIGVFGFYAPFEMVIVDNYALSDPLLARLPSALAKRNVVGIGHMRRSIPRGYLRARCLNEIEELTSELREYYQQLRLITSGALFSWERFNTILRFQTGLIVPPRSYSLTKTTTTVLGDCSIQPLAERI